MSKIDTKELETRIRKYFSADENRMIFAADAVDFDCMHAWTVEKNSDKENMEYLAEAMVSLIAKSIENLEKK